MEVTRREFLKWFGKSVASLGLAKVTGGVAGAAEPGGLPKRPLGKTGHEVTLFSLGGEGVMRSSGRMKEAVPVIRRALELGVNYFDTAPAYDQSQDYLGEGLQGERDNIFLASKTHDRSRDGSLRLLDNSLKRLRTNRLDLWQLHDLRSMDDLDEIFSKNGAIHALERARAEKKVRFFGITGHTDPAVLAEAARRYPFDAALVALNAADKVRYSFIDDFLPVAREKKLGVIGMKVMARGRLLEDPVRFSPEEAIGYVLSLQGVSTVVIGCSSPREVEENVQAAALFEAFTPQRLTELEQRVAPLEREYSFFKKG
jgi:aryl-alcohol dehydrogenase-like predicted oxidoreductase